MRRTPRALLLVLAVLAVLVAGCTTPPPPPGPPPGLRVMTWNVQTGAHDPDEWAPVVADHRPDVLALQEVCTRDAEELADLLRRDHALAYAVVRGPIRPPSPAEALAPINAALGPACDTGPNDVLYGVAVLSRLPVGPPRITTFPPDPRDEQRGALSVEVATPTGPVAVHNSHIGLDGVQTAQIRRLAEVAVGPGPAVVLGDLNVGPDDPELAALRQGFTNVDPDGPATSSRGRIDHVFVRGLVPVGAEVPDVTASDHRPLVVDLRPG
ncbi:endonuclease/exonuclease/phosphatase family protein [Actinomycetospora straminea]|uniref:Endonuclease/exonuclease/phosphatase family protein n=1 Tax=Actinomycetospora straminea TaxID=663607 RepID=A0ABP9EQD5_9PSEU|nr:endonuclease/exonuclease/phosphatase family protein [Actinomycetospora straminea]MDD7933967.1 endonuclease/exonuclease/phosphatase family protein [Actinomycetospora straminea]